jgi:hypothetical protein
MDQLGVLNEVLRDTYLGMPTAVGRSPTGSFKPILDRAWKCMNGWSDRPMSRAGKEALLKAVIQAIPTFIMSYFQIPISTCDSLRRAIADHWWGFEEGKKKMHWRSWVWMCTPKALGGMGFCNLVLFNQAMLGRQCWRLLTEPNSLCARVLKGRYFPHCDFWDAPQPRSSSFTWRSICHGMQLVKRGVLWSVGNGSKIKVLNGPWIPNVRPEMLKTLTPLPNVTTVDVVLTEDHRSWDTDIVRSVFEEEIANLVLQIPITRRGGEDFLSCPFTKYGEYSVRSAYHLARTEKFYVDRSKHGGVIRLKHIYNFRCSMLVLHHLLHVLFTLRGIFMRFPELTY